jgi:uncharacterized protein YprB with RNaseH-like and TPR domain
VSELRRKLARLTETSALEVSAIGDVASPIVIDADPEHTARQAKIAALRALIAGVQSEERAARTHHRVFDASGHAKPLARSVPREKGLPGVVKETLLGPLHTVAQYLLPSHCHGHVRVARALDARAESLAAMSLDPEIASIDVKRVLLLDTETTGLSGGTGTLPFLIGMAWFEDESLHVEQLLLRRPGEEAPMLARLAERMAWASCIVTYNGKSFDWPLIRTRAVMNRIPVPAPRAHLDLLHAARRIFGPRIGSARLVAMEEAVLGLRREADIDGASIPPLFWDFVRGADGGVLAPVIEHNANDLVALAGLLAVLEERWSAPSSAHPPEDRLALARVALRVGDAPRAGSMARAVVDEEHGPELSFHGCVLGADAARKQKDPTVEHSLLSTAVGHVRRTDPRAQQMHLRLAIVLEHRLKDPQAALVHAEHASELDPSSEKRLTRLARKIEKRHARDRRPARPPRET